MDVNKPNPVGRQATHDELEFRLPFQTRSYDGSSNATDSAFEVIHEEGRSEDPVLQHNSKLLLPLLTSAKYLRALFEERLWSNTYVQRKPGSDFRCLSIFTFARRLSLL